MSLTRTAYARIRAATATALAAIVLFAVIACVAVPAPMAHQGVTSCVDVAHGHASGTVAPPVAVVLVAAVSPSLRLVVFSFASRTPARTDIASIGIPPDDPLHGLLRL